MPKEHCGPGPPGVPLRLCPPEEPLRLCPCGEPLGPWPARRLARGRSGCLGACRQGMPWAGGLHDQARRDRARRGQARNGRRVGVCVMAGAHYAAVVTEADVIRWAGVASGVAGSAVSAQSGVLLVVGQIAGFVLSAWRQVLGIFSRPVHHGAAGNTAAASAAGGNRAAGNTAPGNTAARNTAAGNGTSGTGGAGQEGAVAHVRQRAKEELAKVREGSETSEDALTAFLGRGAASGQALRDKVTKEVQEQRRRAAVVNARGLPLIGLGIILTGLPDGLAALGLFGWVAAGVGWAIAGWALWALCRAVVRFLARLSSS